MPRPHQNPTQGRGAVGRAMPSIVYMSVHIWLLATPWTVACQAPLSMGFPRQHYWSGLPFPPPGNLPNRGINLHLLCLLHCRWIRYLMSHPWNPSIVHKTVKSWAVMKGDTDKMALWSSQRGGSHEMQYKNMLLGNREWLRQPSSSRNFWHPYSLNADSF